MQKDSAACHDHRSFEELELDYWSRHFGVSRELLLEAISSVGLEVEAVARYLQDKNDGEQA